MKAVGNILGESLGTIRRIPGKEGGENDVTDSGLAAIEIKSLTWCGEGIEEIPGQLKGMRSG